MLSIEPLVPAWQAPARVRALVTTRTGGVSTGPWASLNLGDHVGDAARAVAENRRRVSALLPAEPVWLRQVHGTVCLDASSAGSGAEGDASWTRTPSVVCAVMTADCLPILLCDQAGTVVAAAHAGWRGLAAGVLAATVTAMAVAPDQLLAWIGPAIGPAAFEVGEDVYAAFMCADPSAGTAFHARGGGKYGCDLPRLAHDRLQALGIRRITSVDLCTVAHPELFFSYRRDGITGRMAACIWLD